MPGLPSHECAWALRAVCGGSVSSSQTGSAGAHAELSSPQWASHPRAPHIPSQTLSTVCTTEGCEPRRVGPWLTVPLTENTVHGTFWKHQQGHWFSQPPRSGSTITQIELGRKAREQERATRAVPTGSSHSQGPGCCVPQACGQRALVWLSVDMRRVSPRAPPSWGSQRLSHATVRGVRISHALTQRPLG